MMIPLLYIYLKETLNTTVRRVADIKNKVTIPYLGDVPAYYRNIKPKKYQFWLRNKHYDPKAIVVKDGSRGVLNEAFRIIATNLEFMSSKTSDVGNLYMTTSYNQGSGKSFVTGNIGAILAVKKNRVLLIDGDLRHASLSKLINSPSKGLADYLSGRVEDYASLICKYADFESLYVLPVGTIPPNPAELLATDKFSTLLSEVKKQFDYVIVDCPPADMMADASIVSRHADRTIFIMRAGLFEREMLPQLEENYKSGQFKNMALILNCTYAGAGGYGYGYGYRYKYGYKSLKYSYKYRYSDKYGYKYGYSYGYSDANDKE